MKERELIRKYALKNAYDYGQAQTNAVVGKIVAEADIEKKKITALMPTIKEEVDSVNSLTREELEKQFHAIEADIKLEKRERGDPLDLDLEPPVIVRSAPNPNGPFHLGNARVYVLNDHYAKLYEGKHYLRFDDTDPRTKKASLEAIEWIKEDLEWLDIKIDETFYASERMELYYEVMSKLIESEKAYVCTCAQEDFREKKAKGIECPCRSLTKEENRKRFEGMLSTYKEGEAVLIVKTDLSLEDPSVRDWIAARIIEQEHAKAGTKYRVWPMYNLQSAVDDHELGITVIIRGQEHAQNEAKQRFLYEYMGWDYPKVVNVGRVKLEGMVLSTSKIMQGINEGKYSGWDDPRLGSIKALRRRGFSHKTIRKAIESVGVKSSDTTIALENLYALNRKYLSEAERYAYIENPIKVDVSYSKKTVVERNKKSFELKEGEQAFYVPRTELETVKGKVFRLKDAYNVRMIGAEEDTVNTHFLGKEQIDVPLVRWATELQEIEILMPDNTKRRGFTEKELLKTLDDIVHLEGLGFCRIEKKDDKKVEAVFAHP